METKHDEAWNLYREERLMILKALVKAYEQTSFELIEKCGQDLSDLENDPGMYFDNKE